MIKRFILCNLILVASLAFGQSTTVSATVTDSAGQVWKNGSYRIDLVNVPSGKAPTWTGGALTQHFPTTALNSSGAFSISLPSTNTITPNVTKWQFTICPNATAPCGQITTTVTGGSLSLSTAITTTIKPPKVNPYLALSKAYSSAEVNASSTLSNAQTGLYYDVTDSCVKFYNGSSWACFSNATSPSNIVVGTGALLVGPRENYICTGTCTVPVPVPVAGYEFCILNDDNISTVITLSALGSSAMYENTARTAYGTSGTGTAVSDGAVGNKICLLGRDSTHYLVTSSVGTWTMN